jgi:NADPH:quinone reductase-like Zn-dependent oxidoreductase
LIYFVIRKGFSRGDKKFRFFVAKSNQEDLAFLKELMEAGKVVPVIDRCYQLSETAQAIRYLGEGKARGKIVITVADNQEPSLSDSHGSSWKEGWR